MYKLSECKNQSWHSLQHPVKKNAVPFGVCKIESYTNEE